MHGQQNILPQLTSSSYGKKQNGFQNTIVCGMMKYVQNISQKDHLTGLFWLLSLTEWDS
jgi:hypothetical protein